MYRYLPHSLFICNTYGDKIIKRKKIVNSKAMRKTDVSACKKLGNKYNGIFVQ